MGSGATDPDAAAYGNLWLQATTTATQLTLTAYTASGTHDPTSNNFPGGTPALLKSQVQGPGWQLKGDGTAEIDKLAGATGPLPYAVWCGTVRSRSRPPPARARPARSRPAASRSRRRSR